MMDLIKSLIIRYQTVIIIVVCAIVALITIKACEQEPKIVTKTETKIVTVRDTIYDTFIEKVPTKVYVERLKTVKGKDSIVYVDRPSDTSIKANKYKTSLRSQFATAELEITSTGEVLDVQGTINYPKETTTITTTKSKDKSGLFIYGSVPINAASISPELGVMYQFKNRFLLKSGVQYNSITNSPEINVGVGIKIF